MIKRRRNRTCNQTTAEMSDYEVIILAGCLLDKETFSAEDLSVMAWEMDNSRFGLRGYQQLYPDHHRVNYSLSKDDGPVKMVPPALVRVGQNLFKMTPHGLQLGTLIYKRVPFTPLEPGDEKAELSFVPDDDRPAAIC